MVGGPGPGDPIFTWKIERKGPWLQVGPGLGPNYDLPFVLAGNPTRLGSPSGVPTFVWMSRRNPGSKPPGEEAKVGEVRKSYFLIGGGLRIGPQ